MVKKWQWNQEGLFFLTKTPVVEITAVGDPCDEASDITGALYQFADQCVKGTPAPDRWGRNYIDQKFLALCARLYVIVTCIDGIVFKSLTTRKDVNQYLVRVQYDDVDLEMEVEEMFHYVSELLKESRKEGGGAPDTPV